LDVRLLGVQLAQLDSLGIFDDYHVVLAEFLSIKVLRKKKINRSSFLFPLEQ
jgi:hypothetical protein